MKFLIDAHLPRRLVYRFQEAGLDAKHTLDLPLKNRTPDTVLNSISLDEKRVLVTKDADFVNSFLLQRKPYKLLLVSTGNIKNRHLELLVLANLEKIVEGFKVHDFIEIDQIRLTFHA